MCSIIQGLISIVIEEEMREKHPFPNPCELIEKNIAHQIWTKWDGARKAWLSSNNDAWFDHKILIAHNPYALHAISPKLFCDYPQFTNLTNGYGWDDGEPL
jgi:hypothetical protein